MPWCFVFGVLCLEAISKPLFDWFAAFEKR
jgi:hypothetical protein